MRIRTSGSILPTGSEALLRCEVSGDPPLTVHWKRFDQLISSIDRYQLSMTSPVNKKRALDLNVSRIEADDAGVYICQAANAYGSDAAEIQLVVQGESLVMPVEWLRLISNSMYYRAAQGAGQIATDFGKQSIGRGPMARRRDRPAASLSRSTRPSRDWLVF